MSTSISMFGSVPLLDDIRLGDVDSAVAAAFPDLQYPHGEPGSDTDYALTTVFSDGCCVADGGIEFAYSGKWYGEQDTLLAALAPFVEDGVSIEYDCDGEPARWLFSGGKAVDQEPMLVWPTADGADPREVLPALGEAVAAGSEASIVDAARAAAAVL